MVERADEQRMTVEEFLEFEGEPDVRYELVDGVVLAMAPGVTTHGEVVANCSFEIASRLRKRPPCRAQSKAGIAIGDDTFLVADVAATCAEPSRSPMIEAPLLLVEVLSPTTRSLDLGRKLDAYKAIDTVREIWLVDSERRWLQIWVREPEGWVGRDLIGSAEFGSKVLDGQVSVSDIYGDTVLRQETSDGRWR